MPLGTSRPREGAPTRAPKTLTVDDGGRATAERLASLGVKLDAQGHVIESPFQGSTSPNEGPDDLGPGVEATVEHVETFHPDRLETDEGLDLPPADEVAEGETPEPPEPEQKVVDKLEKRTADMKAAQKEFSKTETRLRKIEDGINAKLADLDSKIEQLAVLQAASGAPMPELNPADEATVTAYREEFPEAVGVMEALVAPVYTLISQLRDQVNGVGRQVGEYLSKAKQEEVFGAIYKVVPKAKVEEVVASQEFGEWLQTLPPAVRRTNIDIVTKTSSYTPEDALDVLSRFSKDTGIDIGLNGAARRNPPPPPPMDTGPDLRSGSSMPGERPRTPTQPKPTDPLTAYELANFKELLAEARTEAERQLLLQRLRAVPIQVDGDSSVQQFGGRVFR